MLKFKPVKARVARSSHCCCYTYDDDERGCRRQVLHVDHGDEARQMAVPRARHEQPVSNTAEYWLVCWCGGNSYTVFLGYPDDG